MIWFYWVLLCLSLYWFYTLFAAHSAAEESRLRETSSMLRLLASGAGLSALSCVFRLDNAATHHQSIAGFVCSLAATAAIWMGWLRIPRAMAERSQRRTDFPDEAPLTSADTPTVPNGSAQKPMSGLTYLIFKDAEMECRMRGLQEIDTDHLLLGLLNERWGICRRIVTSIQQEDIDIREFTRRLRPNTPTSKDAENRPIALGSRARQALEYAGLEAHRFNSACIRTEHLLLGVLLTGSGDGTIKLFQHGVTVDEVRKQVSRFSHPHSRHRAQYIWPL